MRWWGFTMLDCVDIDHVASLPHVRDRATDSGIVVESQGFVS
jgi:hypothetical protein